MVCVCGVCVCMYAEFGELQRTLQSLSMGKARVLLKHPKVQDFGVCCLAIYCIVNTYYILYELYYIL